MESFFAKVSVESLIKQYLENGGGVEETPLCHIMKILGSDKGLSRHNYTTLYHKLFAACKEDPLHLFEMGIGTNYPGPSSMGPNGVPGASLYGWQKYFSQGSIYGADVDERILFATERIKTYYCDQQSKKSIEEMFSKKDLENILFDVIIDDGLHEFSANFNFLRHSIHKLKKHGIFIVEDVAPDTVFVLQEMLPNLQKQMQLSYVDIVFIPYPIVDKRKDNTLFIVQK